jgi:hypothetical protein
MLAGLDAYLSGVVANVFSGKIWDRRHYCNLSRSLGGCAMTRSRPSKVGRRPF